MAKLYISEYADLPVANGSRVAVGGEPAIAVQTPVAIGGASAQSAAFNAKTNWVRIHTDAICSIKFGSNPTATADDARLAANATEFFKVVAGQKVAVITNT
jgi:hypothetical protein